LHRSLLAAPGYPDLNMETSRLDFRAGCVALMRAHLTISDFFKSRSSMAAKTKTGLFHVSDSNITLVMKPIKFKKSYGASPYATGMGFRSA
jgi:hypothetical protein